MTIKRIKATTFIVAKVHFELNSISLSHCSTEDTHGQIFFPWGSSVPFCFQSHWTFFPQPLDGAWYLPSQGRNRLFCDRVVVCSGGRFPQGAPFSCILNTVSLCHLKKQELFQKIIITQGLFYFILLFEIRSHQEGLWKCTSKQGVCSCQKTYLVLL